MPFILDFFYTKKKVILFMTNDDVFFLFTPNYAPIYFPSSDIFVSAYPSTSVDII